MHISTLFSVPATLLLATTAAYAAVLPAGLEPRQAAGWPACQQTLSCNFDQIQSSSMAERLTYVRYMQSHFFGPLNASNQLRPIEGVIQFFISKNLGPPNSWVSYVDTGIVEAIQRGGALALGLSTETGGNPGSVLWRDFFVAQRDGTFASRQVSPLLHSWLKWGGSMFPPTSPESDLLG